MSLGIKKLEKLFSLVLGQTLHEHQLSGISKQQLVRAWGLQRLSNLV